MSTYVTATDGKVLDLDSLPHKYMYSGNNLMSESVIFLNEKKEPIATYTKSYTYSGGNLTDESQWIKVS